MKLEVDVQDVVRSVSLMSPEEKLHLLRALQHANEPYSAPLRQPLTLEQKMYARTGYDHLTPREKEILSHIVSGKTNKIIALQLRISNRTVEVHRLRVLEKMGARNAVELCNLVATLEHPLR